MSERECKTDALRRALLGALPLLAIAESAKAQDAVRVQPQSYRVALENDHLRVLEYNSRPGMGVCGSGVHSHPAHLTVLLSDARVRETKADGNIVDSGNLPLGTVFWSEPVTHTTENLGGGGIRCLLIELKPAHA